MAELRSPVLRYASTQMSVVQSIVADAETDEGCARIPNRRLYEWFPIGKAILVVFLASDFTICEIWAGQDWKTSRVRLIVVEFLNFGIKFEQFWFISEQLTDRGTHPRLQRVVHVHLRHHPWIHHWVQWSAIVPSVATAAWSITTVPVQYEREPLLQAASFLTSLQIQSTW